MLDWLLDNPVITKEFRGRMRGPRAYWLLFGYLLLLSLLLFFTYLQWWSSQGSSSGDGGAAGFTIGRMFYQAIFDAQAVLVTLITPALTAGAISLERERRTFEMLRATTLPPRDIALGKLTASVSFVLLLLTSSLPLVSLCFLLGGVSPGEVFYGYLLLVADALLFGAVGLAWSAVAANTATATVLSYGTVFVWFALTFPLFLSISGISGRSSGLAAVNPVGAVTASVLPEHYYGWTLAAWQPALILVLALALLLILACVNHLQDEPSDHAGALRVWTLLVCGLLLLFVNGMVCADLWLSPISFGGVSDLLTALVMVAVAAVVLFVPVFVTGEWASGRPWRLWAGTLSAGLPYALLLTGVISGMLFLAIHLTTATATGAGGSYWGSLAVRRLGRVPVGLPNVQPLLWQTTGLLFAVTVGLGGVGRLISRLVRSRWLALIILYLLMIIGMALPYFSYIPLQGQEALAASRSAVVNTLYFCPVPALALIVQQGETPTQSSGTEALSPVMNGLWGFGVVPVWVITASLYLFLGGVCGGVVGWLRRLSHPIRGIKIA